jgi:hypothetical protein
VDEVLGNDSTITLHSLLLQSDVTAHPHQPPSSTHCWSFRPERIGGRCLSDRRHAHFIDIPNYTQYEFENWSAKNAVTDAAVVYPILDRCEAGMPTCHHRRHAPAGQDAIISCRGDEFHSRIVSIQLIRAS